MKARPTNSKLGGIAVLATVLTIFFGLGVASADFHQPGIDCTDCHDMHGDTSNLSLIAEEINGYSPVVFQTLAGQATKSVRYAIPPRIIIGTTALALSIIWVRTARHVTPIVTSFCMPVVQVLVVTNVTVPMQEAPVLF